MSKELRVAVARLVAAEIAEERRGLALRKAWPGIIRELVEANLAMEEFYMTDRNAHPRAEDMSPRFKASGLGLVAASSCDDASGMRRVHVHLRSPAPFTSTFYVSLLMKPSPEFDWDALLSHVLIGTDTEHLPAIRDAVSENLVAFDAAQGADDDDQIW